MKSAYFDCIGGASGDMLLGALVDAGASEAALRAAIEALRLPDCEISFQRVTRGSMAALKVNVKTPRHETPRHLSELLEVVAAADLPQTIKDKATLILRRLGEVEATIHNMEIEHVHLHELGGDDTLIDVVGVLVSLDDLKIEHTYVSPLPLARGFIQSAHGQLPLPAPATLALLEGAPVHYVEVEKELVTPTGAALLTELADGYGGFPPMELQKVGVGAGGRELPFPNVVRLWLGKTGRGADGLIVERLAMLETNIDDMNPQRYDYLMERLFKADALDVTLTPVHMKKNRPGIVLSVLCQPEDTNSAIEVIMQETTTLGVRRYPVERFSLERCIESVETLYGPIRVKVAQWGDVKRVWPEYDDCLQAAKANQVPLEDIIAAARAAYQAQA